MTRELIISKEAYKIFADELVSKMTEIIKSIDIDIDDVDMYKTGYEKGREDALAELIEKLEEEKQDAIDCSNCDRDNQYCCLKDFKDRLEEKEQGE